MYKELIKLIINGWPSSKSALTLQLQAYFNARNELFIANDLVFRAPARVIVPESLRDQVLVLAHQGHQGIVRTKQRIRKYYWWPMMDKNIEDLVKHCTVCASLDKSVRTCPGPM